MTEESTIPEQIDVALQLLLGAEINPPEVKYLQPKIVGDEEKLLNLIVEIIVKILLKEV